MASWRNVATCAASHREKSKAKEFGRIARTLFAVVDEEIVLLHGFIKKQRKTPQDELDLTKKRKKQYLENL
jgi:phage-related protein